MANQNTNPATVEVAEGVQTPVAPANGAQAVEERQLSNVEQRNPRALIKAMGGIPYGTATILSIKLSNNGKYVNLKINGAVQDMVTKLDENGKVMLDANNNPIEIVGESQYPSVTLASFVGAMKANRDCFADAVKIESVNLGSMPEADIDGTVNKAELDAFNTRRATIDEILVSRFKSGKIKLNAVFVKANTDYVNPYGNDTFVSNLPKDRVVHSVHELTPFVDEGARLDDKIIAAYIDRGDFEGLARYQAYKASRQ